MTDNRTNEPSHNRIKIRAFRDGEVSIIHEDQVLGLACTLDELKRAVATYEARGALEAAQGAARPVNSFDTTAEHAKNGADSLHVAPQEPSRLPDFFAPKPMPNSYVPAQVLPSSGIDEDALAEVIAKSRGFGYGWEQIPPLTRGAYREIARAVAAWLKDGAKR